jgi:catechol 2,3-dioxygenase-like lactoylglutathione lyase family enzyme
LGYYWLSDDFKVLMEAAMSTNSADAPANRAKNDEARASARNRNLASIRPSFIVKDLQAAITYYCERLGFQLDFQGPEDGPFWAGVSRDDIGIMLKAVAPDVLPVPNHTRHEWAPPDAHIYSMDPDALFDEFSRRGASFVKKLSFVEEGLWGFAITDADGYVLVFYQLRSK